MTENKRVLPKPWVDPDDAPDLSDADLATAVWQVAGRTVTAKDGATAMRAGVARGRPKAAMHKAPVTLRMDPDALARWRASGKGWQTRAARILAAAAP